MCDNHVKYARHITAQISLTSQKWHPPLAEPRSFRNTEALVSEDAKMVTSLPHKPHSENSGAHSAAH